MSLIQDYFWCLFVIVKAREDGWGRGDLIQIKNQIKWYYAPAWDAEESCQDLVRREGKGDLTASTLHQPPRCGPNLSITSGGIWKTFIYLFFFLVFFSFYPFSIFLSFYSFLLFLAFLRYDFFPATLKSKWWIGRIHGESLYLFIFFLNFYICDSQAICLLFGFWSIKKKFSFRFDIKSMKIFIMKPGRVSMQLELH